ncbi:MAG: hypothetical protein IT238_09585 [Bacteroidia bacterium]|nr:hypothetical protein [Bacteroidia bacterium]MCZ2248130.1 hypothetical protein [Bacteroidia bacterium]
MYKYIFILLNVALLASLRGLTGSDSKPNVTLNIPSSALTGTEFIEEITITKPASVDNFAKFEQQLPPGMVAVGIDTKGGMLTQDENNLVKIIWYKVSDLNEFTIKLRIIVDHETSLNEYAISGRFAYLEKNTRQSVTSGTSKITIEKGAPKQIDDNEKELVQLADTTLHRALTDNIDKMLREAGVACTQVSEMLSKNEVKINIKIVKGKVSGFGKIEEPICEGVTAINIDNAGGVFSFSEGKVKYTWTNLPADGTINVSFKLVRNKEAGWLSRCSAEGEFSYLDGEKSLRCKFNSITVDFEKGITVSNFPGVGETTAQTNAQTETQPSQSVQKEPEVVNNENVIPDTNVIPQNNQNEAAQKVAQVEPEKEIEMPESVNNKVANNENIIEPPKPTKAPEAKHSQASMDGLIFKVQVCATHRAVDASFIKSTYKLPDAVDMEMHEGWNKFTVGGFGQYVEARNKREDLAPYNLPGPFVTAYNNGNRITVQEALMISKQQWVK